MEWEVKKPENPNASHYGTKDLELAYTFARKLYEEFEQFLKSVIIFGSLARKAKAGDIDVMVIVDDVSTTISKELVEAYRIIVEKLINETSNRLHVTTLKLTAFWDYVRNSDPVAINVLRDGYAIIDTGFFDPMQALLKRGKIRPTPESIWNYYMRAPNALMNSNWHVMQATLDLYWAVIDACHAALMHADVVPPTPEHVSDLVRDKLVKPKHLAAKHAITVKKFYLLQKQIQHRQVKSVSGKEYDALRKEAEVLVDDVKKFLEKH